MLTVHKYAFGPNDRISVRMPVDAEILHVDVQRGQPCIWARVDTEAPIEVVIFSLRRTGDPDAHGRHVGSFLVKDGGLVFHLFHVGVGP